MTIREWLAGNRDYEQGRQLYEMYGKNPLLKKAFARGPNSYNREKIVYEMEKMAGKETLVGSEVIFEAGLTLVEGNEEEKKADPVIIYTHETAQVRGILQGNLPPDVYALEVEWRRLYKESSSMQSVIDYMDKQERGESAIKILDNFNLIHEIWRKLDHYKAHGSLPEEAAAPVVTDRATLQQMLMNIRSRISKAKKRGQEEKVRQLEVEREAIEKALK